MQLKDIRHLCWPIVVKWTMPKLTLTFDASCNLKPLIWNINLTSSSSSNTIVEKCWITFVNVIVNICNTCNKNKNRKITKYENIVIKKGIKTWSILKYEKFNEFHNNVHFEAHFLFQIYIFLNIFTFERNGNNLLGKQQK